MTIARYAETSNDALHATTFVAETPKKRRTAVEAAAARLDAAKKRERAGLLKKALVKVDEALKLVEASGVLTIRLDCMDHGSDHDADVALAAIGEAIRTELGE